ncbi:MAG: biopolymer transporter ExbD [Myxococcales bacterium]|nr:biopolymer transporter ExbD [Myxococcales bacterium]MCB9708866.1 biopolymer transporter ExbD [Myxococcales bacterium]
MADGTAKMSEVKRIVRRKLRKREEASENFLNIYPMMDMMTILLVFMVMQFSVTSADVVQTQQLQIPYSTSEREAIENTAIMISRQAITLEGKSLIPLKDGQIDASYKQGGGNGFLITPLFTALERRREELEKIAQFRKQRFSGEVRIVADKRTPFRTLSEVIYSCGQAQFAQMRFVVLRNEAASGSGKQGS